MRAYAAVLLFHGTFFRRILQSTKKKIDVRQSTSQASRKRAKMQRRNKYGSDVVGQTSYVCMDHVGFAYEYVRLTDVEKKNIDVTDMTKNGREKKKFKKSKN